MTSYLLIRWRLEISKGTKKRMTAFSYIAAQEKFRGRNYVSIMSSYLIGTVKIIHGNLCGKKGWRYRSDKKCN